MKSTKLSFLAATFAIAILGAFASKANLAKFTNYPVKINGGSCTTTTTAPPSNCSSNNTGADCSVLVGSDTYVYYTTSCANVLKFPA